MTLIRSTLDIELPLFVAKRARGQFCSKLGFSYKLGLLENPYSGVDRGNKKRPVQVITRVDFPLAPCSLFSLYCSLALGTPSRWVSRALHKYLAWDKAVHGMGLLFIIIIHIRQSQQTEVILLGALNDYEDA